MKRQYQNQMRKQQLDDLRLYTKQLEQSQLDLRKFRHDYKNMLLGIRELSKSEGISAVNQYLDSLSE